jgi:hypothetical protein
MQRPAARIVITIKRDGRIRQIVTLGKMANEHAHTQFRMRQTVTKATVNVQPKRSAFDAGTGKA